MGDYSDGMGWSILADLHTPQSAPNLAALEAWATAEGGQARHNPFNTEQPWPGATDYNSVHVKNYPTEAAGVDATVTTLRNGRYQPILDALARGTNAYDVAYAVARSPWGTGYGIVAALNATQPLTPPWYGRVLKLTVPMMHGPDVITVQRKIGANPDGWYGPQTHVRVITYQSLHHLLPDGVVGPATARVMGPA